MFVYSYGNSTKCFDDCSYISLSVLSSQNCACIQQYTKQLFVTRHLPVDWLACIQAMFEEPCLQALKYHRVLTIQTASSRISQFPAISKVILCRDWLAGSHHCSDWV
jgi:hypothetical protein